MNLLAYDEAVMTFFFFCAFRRYTRYYGSKGDASPLLSHHALTQYGAWEKSIEEWQRPILQDRC